jgi:hypothetical protein
MGRMNFVHVAIGRNMWVCFEHCHEQTVFYEMREISRLAKKLLAYQEDFYSV